MRRSSRGTTGRGGPPRPRRVRPGRDGFGQQGPWRENRRHPAGAAFGPSTTFGPAGSAPPRFGSTSPKASTAASGELTSVAAGLRSPRGRPPPPRNNNLLVVVAVVLLGLGLVVLSAGLAGTNAQNPDVTSWPASSILPGPTHQPTPDPSRQAPATSQPSAESRYQNDDYQAEPPSSNPPPVPNPATQEQARQLLVNNPLYAQRAPRPIRCTLSVINPATASRAQLQQHLTELTGCLMKEWDGVLAAAGYIAVRPSVTIYTQPIQTQCGRVETHNAFYCSADQRVYYAPDFPQIMPPRAANSRLTLLVLIAHEFGHAVQARSAVMSSQALLASSLPKNQALAYSRRFELQADCLAGRFAGALAQSMGFTQQDRDTMAEAWNAIGDDVLWQDPDRVGDHGKGANRVGWLFTGLNSRPPTLAACNTWVAPDQRVR